MCCTVVVWFMEGIWGALPLLPHQNAVAAALRSFRHYRHLCGPISYFFWYMQELVWGDAIPRAPARRRSGLALAAWGETAIFLSGAKLCLCSFIAATGPISSTPVNMLVRTVLVALGGIALYCLYYKYAHFVLGTQKGFSHPQQFPRNPHNLADRHLVDQLVVHGRLAGLEA